MAMKNTFVSWALAGLFVVAFMTFMYTTQENNGLTNTLMDDPILNKTLVNLNSELSTFDSDANNQSVTQDNDDPKTEGGSLLFLSITKTGQVLKAMVFGVFNVLIVLPAAFFGVPSVVIVVIGSIISIILVLSAWRLYKAGE